MGITAKGYRRVYDPAGKRLRMEHDLVWEREYGPIPAGFFIHHINHVKLDNRIENLELADPLSHKRHHSGCELRGGVWWKPCHKCWVFKPDAEYYRVNGGLCPWCKSCQIQNAIRNRRRRIAARRQRPLLAEQAGRITAPETLHFERDRKLGELAAEHQPTAA